MNIGQKLKEQRTAAGLSQEDLAKAVGVSRQTVSSWENNRSYPDIGSIMKLSDLYGASLDELLKEDPVMKKHIENTADQSRKYWSLLFDIAILLLPVGSLIAYWGAAWVGLILRLIGIVMLPPLWIARWKFFGMPKDAMQKSLVGLALCLVGPFVPELQGFGLIVGSILSIAGLLLILNNGIFLERSTRFWLIIALCIGTPVYIFFSGMTTKLDDHGAFSQAQPFGSSYRILEAEYGQVPEIPPTLELSMVGFSLIMDNETVGNFTYIEPREDQTAKGIWQLVPEDGSGLYKLEVSAQDKTTLAYFVDDQLQWRWEIAPVPVAQLLSRYLGRTTIAPINWYPAGSLPTDPADIGYITVIDGESVSFLLGSSGPEVLTVTEEYYHGDSVETTQYQLQKNRSGGYPLPEKFTKRYEDEIQYVVYSFEYDGGVFLLRLNFAQ